MYDLAKKNRIYRKKNREKMIALTKNWVENKANNYDEYLERKNRLNCIGTDYDKIVEEAMNEINSSIFVSMRIG